LNVASSQRGRVEVDEIDGLVLDVAAQYVEVAP
jgi:hypothetical protein